ncbi:etoposide-induced protein 2.4-domain-containing protein [Polychytrium aggregatum]|uniref:etoposide-induced protein 2.4-domain-containing protein n=1 Tax=Polychytrium aggregatum TaxID=110093 RepID=UPI0022FF2103|nr:etoposide-induced protein 2.4-domain-containing protein [Polychytrium aggregatum]KAI9209205.1 etoposide-induced protein 2.4-domain-containing protein [Polychytrium aggregatum]
MITTNSQGQVDLDIDVEEVISPPFYPIMGITYLLAHPSLWLKVICGALVLFAISIGLYIVAFVSILVPQAHGLERVVPGWLAWIISVILCLIEAALLVLIVVALAYPCYLDTLFQKVLELEKQDEFIAETKHNGDNCARGCGRDLGMALFSLLITILTSPLNVIPVLGTVIWVYVNAYFTGWGFLGFYFGRKAFTFSQARAFCRSRSGQVTSFGAVCFALHLVPGFNALFTFTNIIGVALWACDLETKARRNRPTSQSALLTQQV